jgi:hypothetical protein
VPAREKLNAAAISGNIVVAGLAGWLFGSWAVFLLAAVVLIAMSVHTGAIRPSRRRQ